MGPHKRWRALAVSIAVAAVALAVGIGGTAKSESALWPDGRVGVLWPSFSMLPGAAERLSARPFDGVFRRCVESRRAVLDYRCEYADSAGNVGYACLSAGDPVRDLTRESVTAVVAPSDPTYADASPAQVCLASLAYAMSIS